MNSKFKFQIFYEMNDTCLLFNKFLDPLIKKLQLLNLIDGFNFTFRSIKGRAIWVYLHLSPGQKREVVYDIVMGLFQHHFVKNEMNPEKTAQVPTNLFMNNPRNTIKFLTTIPKLTDPENPIAISISRKCSPKIAEFVLKFFKDNDPCEESTVLNFLLNVYPILLFTLSKNCDETIRINQIFVQFIRKGFYSNMDNFTMIADQAQAFYGEEKEEFISHVTDLRDTVINGLLFAEPELATWSEICKAIADILLYVEEQSDKLAGFELLTEDIFRKVPTNFYLPLYTCFITGNCIQQMKEFV